MEMPHVIGIIAAVFTTASFVPQVVRTLRTRDTSAISFWMYLLFVIGILLWLTYGILRTDPVIISANAVTLVLAGIVLIMKIRT
jgi:MtN3 and saliva related transmembrane protein